MVDFGVNKVQERLVPFSARETASPAALETPVRGRPDEGEEELSGLAAALVGRAEEAEEEAATAAAAPAERPGSRDQIERQVHEVNEAVRRMRRNIELNLATKGDDLVVQVVDRDRGKVIREIPPEELLDLRERLKETLGLVFDREG
ncbi:MAG: flagellar protein FlaG [Planctomycetes bacterium]|nr:flagellar protein FlaG [Planctomycetota bacterium]